MLPRQGVQRLVNAALDLGLVRTAPNPAHRRSSLVEPTAAGLAAFARVHDREEAILRGVAARMRREELDACLRVVAQLTDEFRGIARHDQGARGEETW